MSRSTAPREIQIYKSLSVGIVPPFLGLAHRHFQKSQPTILDEKEATLVVPVDLLDLLVPAAILDAIESIEIVYQKKG